MNKKGRPINKKMIEKIGKHLKNGLKVKQISILEKEDRQLIDYYIRTYPQLQRIIVLKNKSSGL
ncbi:MAG: hypothetical protein K9M15_01630 [Candidatus Marinimicrobia bacterium]|nr:hypothetical protein [Candidatus Neomarinimicrobiota bacterium]